MLYFVLMHCGANSLLSHIKSHFGKQLFGLDEHKHNMLHYQILRFDWLIKIDLSSSLLCENT